MYTKSRNGQVLADCRDTGTFDTAPFSAMPMQIVAWARQPQAEFQHIAAAGTVVLVTVLLLMNATAIVLRNRYD
jgi:phosphate transport system permease protein